jgi:SAM-dependent methyltransferase
MSLTTGPREPDIAREERHGLRDGAPPKTGLARSIRLVRAFRTEQADPESYYSYLAQDTASQVEEYTDLAGRLVLDIGGGAGYFASAFAERGARCAVIERDPAELLNLGAAPAGAILGDGCQIPVRDRVVDVCFSSNVLEHVKDPVKLIDEMVRVTSPGGLIYLSFTNWYSPWGGHEMSPWHYLGAGYAERRYLRRHGRLPKNRPGVGLYPVHIGSILRLLRSRPDIEIVDARPRYYPRWSKAVLRVPGLREIVTWNLLTILRRLP